MLPLLKPYKPQNKQSEDEYSTMKKFDMQTVKSVNKVNTIDSLAQSRLKRNIKSPVKLDL